jgi:glycosyltransferase involved in cell wall biosynthesis
MSNNINRETNISIVIPAKNESSGLKLILPRLKSLKNIYEVIVVDDGSEDDTPLICNEYNIKTIRHAFSLGNGAAIKTGARAASGEYILFMDGDGQHTVEDVNKLIDYTLKNKPDMLIGARNSKGQASIFRSLANRFYNWFATKLTGQKIEDLTSGMRVVNREKFLKILYLLPNGFSYPTTSAMAFIRSGFSVEFIPIDVQSRIGKSHINIVRDGFRFFIIIIKIGTLYSPLKIFIPLSLSFFLTGLGYYIYTYINMGRFTNMSALLLSTSILTFLIGLVSEQITTLIYKDTN